MSKLSIDQKTIEALFSDKKTDFLIPDYQRPYAWEEKECQQLWDDIFSFAFPDDDYEKFNSEDEYYLGTIVTFKNEGSKKLEVIDGQQRLTTLMLLLRAFYSKFSNMKDKNSIATRETIGKCLWKGDEFGNLNTDVLKIDSQVATDNDKDEFLDILRKGEVTDKMKSNYAKNYTFFVNKIAEFLSNYPSFFPYLPNRILKNCILLPIEAESQDTALRIFSTLNNRGLPLSDADIFKSEFYKKFTKLGRKDEFIKRWKTLEENILDVAGVRVVCSFVEDVYLLADALLKQDDISLIEKKDYIANPKENGYRSLHLIVAVPIYLEHEKRVMPVEIQLRTIAMDFWASLEHQLRYKKDFDFTEDMAKELQDCADLSAHLDARMDSLRERVESQK